MQSKSNANTGIALSWPLKVPKCYRKVFWGIWGLEGTLAQKWQVSGLRSATGSFLGGERGRRVFEEEIWGWGPAKRGWKRRGNSR